MNDARYALRWLRRSPGVAAVAILSLGLGVGVNTGMFSLVDALLLRPLPVRDPATLVDVFTTGGDGDVHATTSYPDYLDLKTTSAVFADAIGYAPMFAALGLGERSRLVLGQVVTSNFFQMLGVEPWHGRLLTPDDDRPGAPKVAVLSHRMWVHEFGSAPDIVGRVIYLRSAPYTIVGVAPARFTGVVPLIVPELWVPIAQIDDVEPAGIIDAVPGPGSTPLERRGYRWMFVKGRLRPGVTAAEAAAGVPVLGARLASAYPATNKGRAMSAVPTKDVRMLVPEAGGPLAAGGAAVMAAVGLVLLIACANVAGLLLARASAREREMSVRRALGATRGRLVRQLLVEGAVIGLAGIVVAIAVASLIIRGLLSIELPMGDLPLDLGLDRRVLAFSLGLAVLSGLVASLTPALKASSGLIASLRGPLTTGMATVRRWGLREVLVAGQMALTIVLLVVAGTLLRSVSTSRAADLGFETRGLALVSIDADMVRYTPERSREFWAEAVTRVGRIPGVASVATSSPRVPLEVNFSTAEFHVDDRTYAEGQRGEILNNVAVSTGYFDTLGVKIVRGRDFSAADREGAPLVAVVSEAMARRYWPDSSPIGRTITVASTKRRYEIVGVSADYKVKSVQEPPTPYVHFAAAQRPASYNTLIARTLGDTGAVLAAMRRELLSLEPRLVFISHSTMERTLAATLLPARVGSMLATGFGALGTLLAAVGLYGVVAFAVGRRTREIGIRLALGATRRDVLWMVVRQGGVLVAAGATAGVILAVLAAGALSGVLYGVSAVDPLAWAGAAGVIAVATALAHFLPARRAMRIEPAKTLRME